ncbi:ArsR family transcriptional regulator [Pseudomonas cavernicola]|uniref:ArsR family transcriptional regulator n=1 Tax=Pseudomonas cavernicola TaxID=2320866 RepID=A0A418XBD0_9PSED|nr:metalloregulator ArsR/SmtB family transcription factor [Pseudomonas cavernicola]RJG09747.1 ArsR family transcriptional regulator [Pseudomonas cavernicola]
MLTPVRLFKALSDETRLRCLALIGSGERCVCELTSALDLAQPKISRHLAQLRSSGVLLDRRQGQWVYYQINPALPDWASVILRETLAACAHEPRFVEDATPSEPQGDAACCA